MRVSIPFFGVALAVIVPFATALLAGEPLAATEVPAYVHPRGYVCYRAAGRIKIDGRLDDAVWQDVPWTEEFMDIEGKEKEKPRFRTRVKMIWDDDFFYVAAELREPHVWATLADHDSIIFHDNDFEVFFDPDGDSHNYGELEINARNTTWDLLLPKPYKDGGKAINGWEIAGMKTAVHVQGSLNDPGDKDDGWTIEIALPWKALSELSAMPVPPKDGDHWRINFARVEWEHEIVGGKYQKAKGKPASNWTWSPQGVVDMHRPDMWGYVQFSTAKIGAAEFEPDPAGPAKHLLHYIHSAQRDYKKEHQRYAKSLEDIECDKLKDEILGGPFKLEVTETGYEAAVDVRVSEKKTQRWRIRQDGRIWNE